MKLSSIALGLVLSLAALLSGGCASAGKDQARAGIATLRNYMVGSYSSAEQAAADPENYRDIRLEMVQIWPERTDGTWLYVEQAVAGSIDKPYRQRVYRLTANADHTFRSDVFTLPEPAMRYAGAWLDGNKLGPLTAEQLTLKDGCAITLTWQQDSSTFTGSTTGPGCESTLQGAAYAASEASFSPFGMTSWDRGYDSAGNQVWGSTKGGYIFVKKLYEQ